MGVECLYQTLMHSVFTSKHRNVLK